MRYTFILYLILSILVGCSSSDDAFDHYTVDFFISSPEAVYFPPVFETVTEQVLLKEAYKEGAIFETVSELVLAVDGYWDFKIEEFVADIPMVVNMETEEQIEVPCYQFFSSNEPVHFERETQFQVRQYQKVVTEGSGPEIPAQYGYISYLRLVEAPYLSKVVNGDPFSFTATFTIPSGNSIEAHIANQVSRSGMEGCFDRKYYTIR